MLAVTRAHFTFSGEAFFKGAAGWSETYFMTVPDYTTAASQISSIVNARIPLLCSDVQFIGASISDTAVKGDSFPSGLAAKPGTYVGTAGVQTYQPDDSLRILFHAGQSKRGTRFIHCIPSDQINVNGQYNSTAPFATAMNTFLTLVEQTAALATKLPGAAAPPFYTLTPYTSFLIIGMLGRRIGRPFSLRRGRALIA